MSSEALYTKYRPQNFDDVLGQGHVVDTLRSAAESGSISHAYIFSGTRGTGKTSLARIFAKAIGTTDRDLYEMDAASNRGIDEIRALRDEIHSLPFESKYKVYIIDEAHMLTKEAFNALLKTLEEPPEHVVFILATTEFSKLPDTIVSRCQTFTFKTPGTKLIKEMLVTASKREKVNIEPSAIELIALLASGSFRDAYGILQKVITTVDHTKVSLDDVAGVTGAPRNTLLLKFIDAVAVKNTDVALTTLEELASHGNDMQFVLTLLLRYVRAILLIREASSLIPQLETEFSEEEFVSLEHHAKDSRVHINSRLLARLLDASMYKGDTAVPQLPLELVVLEHLEQS